MVVRKILFPYLIDLNVRVVSVAATFLFNMTCSLCFDATYMVVF